MINNLIYIHMSTVLYLFFMVSDSYLKHIKSVPEPCQVRTCSVSSPYKGTSEWRMYGAGTDLTRFRYGVGRVKKWLNL
ncbi:hypothetical protein DWW10_04560 [Bacteroides intestinalis]|uniref:Uncharacterized protein n=1 Tax=Bacteroides intestinalis TaxID=329854 RepID=A0A412YIQ6_9BACE|nr:hypothetical protein DWW10_04560 [Bacteroides intestinalis]RHA61727.1 hypothetical protein DW932_05960 [Bacteroides intestinalis]